MIIFSNNRANAMNIKLNAIFIVVIAAVSFGCGSSQPETNLNSKERNPAANRAGTNAAVSPAANVGQNQVPGIPGPNDASNVDVNTPGDALADQNRRKIVDVPANGPQPKPMAVDASEDSSIVTIMDKTGIATETRTFRSDQYIARLVKQTSATGAKVTIYLKSGKAVSVEPSRVPQVNTVSLATLRELAGIKPPAATTDTGSKGSTGAAKKP